MQTIAGNLYDYPGYYDLVFGSDWDAELRFLQHCFARYARGTVRRVFEPACGTGRLLYRLGRKGYQVSGLDLNAHAVDYCNARLARHGLPAAARVGDMAAFHLPRLCDAAMNLINSFRHLPTDDAAHAHLQCVSRALRSGGLFILAFHLTPRHRQGMDEERWSARRGNLCVNTRLWTKRRDLRRRREWCGMILDVYTPTRALRIRDELVFRTYTRRQFQSLLSQTPELEVLETFDFTYDVHLPTALTDETEDVVFVLRKR